MILPVFLYGSPVLRKVAADIPEDYEGLDELVESLFETMYSSEGVGLAAPQVGKSLRIFVVDASPLEEDDPSLKDFKKVFINPVITSYEGELSTYNEGCLSIPEIREDVDRETAIRIRYCDTGFKYKEEYYDGIAARIIQHEYDHLEGRLFTDMISPIRKRLLKRKLTSISKGRVDVKYRVKHL
ncbi:MAG: peptide deformylase [Marinilabiliales bacterium]|nr:MAG: peptide deformylase [Marinilabiliales bacterium]